MPRESNQSGGGGSAPKKSVSRPSYLGGSRSQTQSLPVETKAEPVVSKPASEDKALYEWKIWLFPRRPMVSAIVVLVVLGSLALAYWTYPEPLFIAIIALILLNRLALYLFPVKYTIGEVTVGYETLLARDKRTWDKFFTYYQFPDGVLLAHDTRGLRGRLKEGLFLYYNRDLSNKEQILDLVKARLKPPKEAMRDDQSSPSKGGILSAWRRVRRAKQSREREE